MFRIFIFLITVLPFLGAAQQKEVCFTYDDLPVVAYGETNPKAQHALMSKLVGTLADNRIPATGFVNETKLFNGDQKIPFQVDLLSLWVDAGLELGNHTYSHPDYNTTPFNVFVDDVIKGENVTREMLNLRGKQLTYFRHPYLHTGATKEKSDSLDYFLTNRGYTVAPVTLDNDDYLFALAYRRALNKKDEKLARQIGADYVLYMKAKLEYFEGLSKALFDRYIPQILLLHSSQLNADHTQALAEMFRSKGYTFVGLDHVLKDPAYSSPVSAFGKWGISWLERWALSQGHKGDFFKGDPATPEYIVKLAQ